MADFKVTLTTEEVKEAINQYVRHKIDVAYGYTTEATEFLYNSEYKDSMVIEVSYKVTKKETK